jgi:polar amino acid transport system substrate-binding protein
MKTTRSEPSTMFVLLRCAAAALLVALSACSPISGASDQPTPSTGPVVCAKGQMPTRAAGKLTIGVQRPTVAPYFINGNPENGQGFESALAYAIAKELGYDKADVDWLHVPFESATQPGPKLFDFDINEFTITPERAAQVDFSEPYLDNRQTAVIRNDATAAPKLSDLRKLRIGVQIGTTSHGAVTDFIKPVQDVAVFNDHEEVKSALSNGSVQAMVTDLPTAVMIANFEVKNVRVLGQIAPDGVSPEQFGIVLDKGSKLTDCVSQAIRTLKQDRTLDALATEWLAIGTAPILVND